MNKLSIFSLLGNAWTGHKRWKPFWSAATVPKPSYDVVIVGGGGHGLATAYYLASHHAIRNVAVLEKGWIGGGNSGRNTQSVRSNYFWPQSAGFFDRSLRLLETLGRDLNFNIMLSQRGILNLAHSEHELEMMNRQVNAIQINGIDSEMLTVGEIRRLEPLLNTDCRFPVVGGFMQRRSGIARHDAVVWAYARAANTCGVDIIQDCEVVDLQIAGGRIRGVDTTLGEISSGAVAITAGGHTSELARMAGLRVPITSMALQAMVSEPVKPCLSTVVTSSSIHAYVSQSDRGELVMGGGADVHNSYAQRGGLPMLYETVASLLELFPVFARLHLVRQWAGTVDITPDSMPILGHTPVDGLFLSGGWGTGGFKAIPAGGETMAHTIATGRLHPLISAFTLKRFETGRLIDEGAAAGVAH